MENLNLTLKDFSNTAKALEKTLTIDPKISKHTLAESLTETLVELKATVKTMNDNLAFDQEKGEKPLGKQLKATLKTVNQTVAEVNDTIEQSRQGWAGWALGASKPKAAQKPVEKTPAKKVPTEKAPVEKASVEKATVEKVTVPTEKVAEKSADVVQTQAPGWFSSPLNAAWWGRNSTTPKPTEKADDKPAAKTKEPAKPVTRRVSSRTKK